MRAKNLWPILAFLAVAAAGLMLALSSETGASDSPGTTERVSVASDGNQGNDYSRGVAISADGRYVAFESFASNLVPGDTNRWGDIFVHERETGVTERVSVDSAGNQGNWGGNNPAISADGRYVAFSSSATNLVPDDSNGWSDVFVHDRQTGATTRISVDSAGNEGNGNSWGVAISADGRYVAFESFASNLVPGDTNRWGDIFVHERETGVTERVSVDSAGNQGNNHSAMGGAAAISTDGRYVAFYSMASNLVPGDTNICPAYPLGSCGDAFVRDRQTGVTQRVSVDSAGNQANGSSGPTDISGDGRYVAIGSGASDLVAGDTNTCDINHDGQYDENCPDAFVHDRQTGATQRVSVDSAGNQGNAESFASSISADGRYVALVSAASNLVPGDTNGVEDVFVHDRQTGTTTRISVDSGGNQGNSGCAGAAISADGRYVAFVSAASNLVPGDTNGIEDVFVRDRCPGGSCGGSTPDSDGDGVPDASDQCPDTPPGQQVDANGCSQAQVDQDLDGICDPGKTSTLCSGSDICPVLPEQANGGQDDDGCPERQIILVAGISLTPHVVEGPFDKQFGVSGDCLGPDTEFIAETRARETFAGLYAFLGVDPRVPNVSTSPDSEIPTKIGYGPRDFLSFNYYRLISDRYSCQDTQRDVRTLAALFDSELSSWMAENPMATFDIVGHSLGGALVAYWAGTRDLSDPRDLAKLARVHAVLTFDSPLQGLTNLACSTGDFPFAFGGDAATSLCDDEVKARMADGVRRLPFFAFNDEADWVVHGALAVGRGMWWPELWGQGLVWGSTFKQHDACPRYPNTHGRTLCLTDGDVRSAVHRAFLHQFADDRPEIASARGDNYAYTGDWQRRDQDSRIQGTLTASSTIGATLHYERAVLASKLAWATTKGPLQGKASVAVCGIDQGTVDLRTPSLTQERTVFSYEIPDSCVTPSVDIEVVPTVVIPSRTICPPIPPRLPPWVPRPPCITTPEIKLAGEVQIDAFEFE